MRVGGNPSMANLEIVEPTEKDKGLYTFELADAEKTYTRTLELSGQGKRRSFWTDCSSLILCFLIL